MSKPIVSPSSVAAQRWAPPAVQGQAWDAQRGGSGVFDKQERAAIDAAHAKAHAEGYAAGRAEFDARNADLNASIARIGAIANLLSRPLNELDVQVEQQLVTLALTVARHLVRRELRIDPTQVIAIIRETVALLPAAARDVRVHLHPEDAALVRERLSTPQAARAWTVIEDPVMGRGGCRVTTDTAQIDARLETRLGTAISNVMGSDRIDPREANAREGKE
jgi:flagellar assembly protein FliH